MDHAADAGDMRIPSAALLALLLSAIPGHVRDSESCTELSKLALPNTAITLAAKVDAGTFTPPAQTRTEAYRLLPAFCRVAATLKPTPDSDIKVEVWLPLSNWNGKFMAVGNGAFNGAISYAAMGTALTRGYAVSSTDRSRRR
jgi:feruloyl esterase